MSIGKATILNILLKTTGIHKFTWLYSRLAGVRHAVDVLLGVSEECDRDPCGREDCLVPLSQHSLTLTAITFL